MKPLWGKFGRAVVWGALLHVISQIAIADEANESWMPDVAHFAAAARSQDCVSFRRVARREQMKLQQIQQHVQTQVAELKKRRGALEACALGQGFHPKTIEDETVIAEICHDAYEAWLAPSYRMMMYREDMQNASQTVEELRSYLQGQCSPSGIVQAQIE